MILDSRSPNKKNNCLRITMYCMDVQQYTSLNMFFKGKVQCPDFTLFLSGLYDHVHMGKKLKELG